MNKKYKVIINQRAIRDLDEIYEYIAQEKLSPQNAKAQADRIKIAIFDLSKFPQSHQERLEGSYAGKGYRQLLVDNYVVVFKIEEEEKQVRVITVQYQGRNI